MNKEEKKFYDVFTNLQCFILANMNKGNINGVTATHYNLIDYIYRNDKSTSKQIAKSFNISPAAISRQLKFLIQNRLIEQDQSTEDRRVFYLSVTEKGKFIIDNSENFRERVAKTVSQSLSPDELQTLTALLLKMLNEIAER